MEFIRRETPRADLEMDFMNVEQDVIARSESYIWVWGERCGGEIVLEALLHVRLTTGPLTSFGFIGLSFNHGVR